MFVGVVVQACSCTFTVGWRLGIQESLAPRVTPWAELRVSPLKEIVLFKYVTRIAHSWQLHRCCKVLLPDSGSASGPLVEPRSKGL